MRNILIILVTVGLIYGLYSWFGPEPEENPATTTTTEASINELGARSQEQSVSTPQAAPPPPPPGAEEQLRTKVAKGDTGARIELARLLLQRDPRSVEAIRLLRETFEVDERYRPVVAPMLLRSDAAGDGQLEAATYVHAQGTSEPEYARACFVLGKSKATRTEDSYLVEAWHLLSEAYFATLDPAWRNQVRPELSRVATQLLLTPRRTAACKRYRVESGDSLARIAKQNKTTVEALRLLNGLDGDLIHAGQSFKILEGEITIEVDKSDFRLDARLDGKFLFSAPVGLGEHGKTPVADFTIDQRIMHPSWFQPGKPEIPYGHPENALGDYWLGFKDTAELDGFGIHGTNDESTIGLEASDGCIRLRNNDIETLYQLTPTGTRVTVRE